MNYAHPQILWLLFIGTPLLGLFFWLCWRKKQRLIEQFVHSRLLDTLMFGVSHRIQILRFWLVTLAVASLFFALARPRWGYGWEESVQVGRDVIVAIDVSKSMLAGDVAPDRITRAKLAAFDLARLSKSDRLGLVAFAGTAFLQCPLTLDEEAFRQSVEILEPGLIPEGGSIMSAAIETALEAFKKEESNHRALILITDGEAHEENAVAAAEDAARKGVRIFTVGVGTPAGHVIQVQDQRGAMTYLKDEQGNVVKSRLNEELLGEIAKVGGGFYVPLQGANAMQALHERGLASMPTTETTDRLVRQWKERFQIPLALGIVLLLVEIMLPERGKRKRSIARISGAQQAALWAMLLAVWNWSVPAALASKREAQRAYNNGAYAEAQKNYETLLAERPGDPTLAYNAGAAAFKAGSFDAAFKHFNAATVAKDLKIQERAYYNAGNSLFRLGESAGDPQKTIPVWEQALKQYDSALKLDPEDADAKHNRELVQRRLEELKKQNQQQNKSDQKDENKDQKEKDQKQDQQKQDNQQQGEENQKQQNQSDSQEGSDKQQQQDSAGQKKEQQSKQSKEQQPKDEPKEQPGDKPDPKTAQKPSGAEKEQQNGQPREGGSSQQTAGAMMGKMTPEQAKQLLEAQRNEERTMVFRPGAPEKERPRQNAERKDW
ncbi:MAG TPA: VWA domain-containing protein [Methylomirabilota bacterium]|nr:VWA domain-containing protein [Methylomirabilota bacterium]